MKFVSDRLLRALSGEAHTAIPRLDQPMVVIALDLSPADTAGMVREPVDRLRDRGGDAHEPHRDHGARARDPGGGRRGRRARDGAHRRHRHRRRPARRAHVHPTEEAIAEARAAIGAAPRVRPRPPLVARSAVRHRRRRAGEPQSERRAPGRGDPRARSRRRAASAFTAPNSSTSIAPPSPTRRSSTSFTARSSRRSRRARSSLRTFDIGGDKFASTFQLPAEMNPALGLRAVRLALRRPDVFLDPAPRHGPRQRARRSANHDPHDRQRVRDARSAKAPRARDAGGRRARPPHAARHSARA